MVASHSGQQKLAFEHEYLPESAVIITADLFVAARKIVALK